MGIEDEVRDAMKRHLGRASQADRLQKLAERMETLRKRGLLKREPYSLPPLDTIGRGAESAAGPGDPEE